MARARVAGRPLEISEDSAPAERDRAAVVMKVMRRFRRRERA